MYITVENVYNSERAGFTIMCAELIFALCMYSTFKSTMVRLTGFLT